MIKYEYDFEHIPEADNTILTKRANLNTWGSNGWKFIGEDNEGINGVYLWFERPVLDDFAEDLLTLGAETPNVSDTSDKVR